MTTNEPNETDWVAYERGRFFNERLVLIGDADESSEPDDDE